MLFALVCQGCCGSYGICGFLDMARQISRRQYKYGTDIHSTDIHSTDSIDIAQKFEIHDVQEIQRRVETVTFFS